MSTLRVWTCTSCIVLTVSRRRNFLLDRRRVDSHHRRFQQILKTLQWYSISIRNRNYQSFTWIRGRNGIQTVCRLFMQMVVDKKCDPLPLMAMVNAHLNEFKVLEYLDAFRSVKMKWHRLQNASIINIAEFFSCSWGETNTFIGKVQISGCTRLSLLRFGTNREWAYPTKIRRNEWKEADKKLWEAEWSKTNWKASRLKRWWNIRWRR
jgi:hypothetical protein